MKKLMIGLMIATAGVAAEAASALPADLQGSVAAWFDANVNVVTDGPDGVVEWRDVRETDVSGAPTYPRLLAYRPNPANIYAAVLPTLTEDAERFPGKKLVDFGEYFSGQWLYFADSNGGIVRQPVCAYVGVIGFHGKSYGFLLSDTASLDAQGSGVNYFHKGTASAADCFISAAPMNSVMSFGETRIDGEVIDPRSTRYAEFQVFAQNGPRFVDEKGKFVRPFASTLFNDRNYKKAGGVQDRQGGGIVGELLVFDRPLAAAELREVENYLSEKWFGKTCAGEPTAAVSSVNVLDPSTLVGATVMVDSGVTAVSAAGAAPAAAVEAFASPSQNLLSDAELIEVPYDAESQTVTPVRKDFTVTQSGLYRLMATIARDPAGTESEGELVATFTLDRDNAHQYCHVVRTDALGGVDVAKRYQFTLPYLAVGAHRLDFSITRGNSTKARKLVLSDVAVSPIRTGEFVSIQNPGFDSSASSFVGNYYSQGANSGGWTFSPESRSGITCDSTYWWKAAGFAGDELADLRRGWIQKDAAVSQMVTIPRAGRIRFSMRYANRGNQASVTGNPRSTGHHISVTLGGVEIATAYPLTQENRLCVAECDVIAGEQELKIQGVLPDASDYSSIIDDIALEYIDGVTAGTPKQFAVTADEAGSYRLIAELAGPIVSWGLTNGYSSIAAQYPLAVEVSFDGAVVGTASVGSDEFSTCAFFLPALEAGEHQVAVSTAATGLRVRAVRLEKVTDLIPLEDDLLKTTTFDIRSPGKLLLDYAGVLSVGKVKVEGKNAHGTLSAVADPVHFMGVGGLYSAAPGLMLLFR